MADRYWVGGGSSANWAATGNTNWGTASNTQDNAAEPTAADDVFFDGVGTGAANCTIAANAVCRSINCTGYTNTITQNSSCGLTIGDGTAGAGNIALKFVSGMGYNTGNSTVPVTFISTSATQQTIETGGKLFGIITWNAASGGSWILNSSLSNKDAFGSIAFTKGTLNTNGQTLSVGKFQCDSGLTRSLILGTSQITLTGTGGWQFSSGALTLSAASSTIIFGTNSSARTFAGSGQTYGTLSYIVNGSTGMLTISGNNTFNTINFTDTTNARTLRLTAGSTQIVTTLNINGTSGKLMSIDTQTAGSAATISKTTGVVSLDYLSIKDSVASGGATFYAGANSTSVSGNSGWIFTAPPVSSSVGGGAGEIGIRSLQNLLNVRSL